MNILLFIKKYWLLAVNVLLAGGLLIFLLPTLNVTDKLYTELLVREEQTRQEEQTIKTQLEAEKYLASLEKPNLIERALPPQENFLLFIETLENLAEQAGVQQELAVDSQKRTVREEVVEIPITLTLDGSWENTFTFLQLLEKKDYYVTPVTIEIKSTATPSWSSANGFNETVDGRELKLFTTLIATTFWTESL